MREAILEYMRKEFSEEIDYGTNLMEYVDSFSLLVVLMFLEKTFNIKITDFRLEDFETIDTIPKLVEDGRRHSDKD